MKLKNAMFELYGTVPSKKNSKRILKRGPKRFIGNSARYSEWEPYAVRCIISQNTMCKLSAIKCTSISIAIQYGDMRRRDLTNTAEGVMDALVKALVIADDNWENTGPITLIPSYKKDEPKIIITITYVD